MGRVRVLLPGWIVLTLLTPLRLAAQASEPAILRGRVIDARTASPLRDVSVVFTLGHDTVARLRSDSTGVFQSAVGAATTVVAHFTRLGYHSDSIASAGWEFPLRVAMVPIRAAANALAAVVVRDTARSSFERRARRNSGGSFIRVEDIERKKPLRTSDLFRGFPGVRIDDSSGVTQLVSLRSTRQRPPTARTMILGGDSVTTPSTNAGRCVLRVGTDGRLMPPDYSVDDVRPGDVVGIELYLGAATIPAEFSGVQHDAPCGIIMIWTKTGRER